MSCDNKPGKAWNDCSGWTVERKTSGRGNEPGWFFTSELIIHLREGRYSWASAWVISDSKFHEAVRETVTESFLL